MDDAKETNEELTVYWVQAQPLVQSFVASLVPDFSEADDILQNVALVTTRRFAEYDRQRPFVAWTIGIAKTEISNYRRKNGKRPILLDVPVMESIAKTFESEAARMHDIKKETERALAACIDKLGDKWKHILELHYLREHVPARIAQQLGMTKNNVLVTLYRIRTALRTCVNQQLRQEAL